MEVNVGNQSWVHWSMHLAKYVHTKRVGRDVPHCTHVLLTQHANYLCNNAMKRQYHWPVKRPSCNVAAMVCAGFNTWFFKLSSPAFTTLCMRWHPQRSQSHSRVLLKALATLPPQSVTIAGKSTYNWNKWHCSTASLATTVHTQQNNS